MTSLPRQLKPELEHDYVRSPDLGYESPDEPGFIRCLAHGFPTPLARWHQHDEYELHLITATSGKVFVGDWIGHFQPGHLVLTGPRLPHNWVSTDVPEGGVAERDLVIQFLHAPIETGSQHIPELREVLPLLERAKHGIEVLGIFPQALERVAFLRLLMAGPAGTGAVAARQGAPGAGATCRLWRLFERVDPVHRLPAVVEHPDAKR